MPIWSEILRELNDTRTSEGLILYDEVRRKYLLSLYHLTGRNVIWYASAWLQKDVPAAFTSIADEDIQALMEVTQGLDGDNLDLILHSPGGSVEAAEAIVSYLRSRFSHIRVIVPNLAMSAAAMISCAADEIVLGKHSFLGPTDPQIILPTPLGVRQVPAQAVIDQFLKAQQECADSSKMAAWLPMLNQYGPDLLVRCSAALDMSKDLVQTWLEAYMFKGKTNGREHSVEISDWLANHQHFKSHGRHISRDDLEEHKLKIVRLESDPKLQDAILSVFHATTHAFSGGSIVVKIVENHTGRAFMKQYTPPTAQAQYHQPPPP